MCFGFCFDVTRVSVDKLLSYYDHCVVYSMYFSDRLCNAFRLVSHVYNALTQRSCKNVNIYLGIFFWCLVIRSIFGDSHVNVDRCCAHMVQEKSKKSIHQKKINVKKQVKKPLILSFFLSHIDRQQQYSNSETVLFFLLLQEFRCTAAKIDRCPIDSVHEWISKRKKKTIMCNIPTMRKLLWTADT